MLLEKYDLYWSNSTLKNLFLIFNTSLTKKFKSSDTKTFDCPIMNFVCVRFGLIAQLNWAQFVNLVRLNYSSIGFDWLCRVLNCPSPHITSSTVINFLFADVCRSLLEAPDQISRKDLSYVNRHSIRSYTRNLVIIFRRGLNPFAINVFWMIITAHDWATGIV